MKHKIESLWAACCGLGGGLSKWVYLDASFGFSWWHLVEAGGTALICGFLGALGKELYDLIKKAWKEYRNNYKSKI